MTGVDHRGEALLRTWGAHQRARLEGCPTEDLSRAEDPELAPGDVAAHRALMAERFPKLSYERACELVKYGPLPRAPIHPGILGVPDIEAQVSRACLQAATLMRDRFVRSEFGAGWGDLPNIEGYTLPMFVQSVRYLLRAVYVEGKRLRKWPGCAFDDLYPYSVSAQNRARASGREATLAHVKDAIEGRRPELDTRDSTGSNETFFVKTSESVAAP